MNSLDSVLRWMEKTAEQQVPISPTQWLDCCAKLNALSGGLSAELYKLERELARKRSELLIAGSTVAAAKVHIESLEDFETVQLLKAKMKRVEESIRIGKLMARTANDEYNR